MSIAAILRDLRLESQEVLLQGVRRMHESKDTVLIMDDEPHVLDWLIEYLEAKNYKVKIVTNVDEAISELNEMIFRVTILDLNVPASDMVKNKLEEKGSVYKKYRGLYAAVYARTKGHRGRQVIVYSVHDSQEVQNECRKIGIQYLIKARPREFKKELNDILSFDPTEDQA
jgi:CheY-like chemotaxis protein